MIPKPETDQRFNAYLNHVFERLPSLALGSRVKLSGDKVVELMREAYESGENRTSFERSVLGEIFERANAINRHNG